MVSYGHVLYIVHHRSPLEQRICHSKPHKVWTASQFGTPIIIVVVLYSSVQCFRKKILFVATHCSRQRWGVLATCDTTVPYIVNVFCTKALFPHIVNLFFSDRESFLALSAAGNAGGAAFTPHPRLGRAPWGVLWGSNSRRAGSFRGITFRRARAKQDDEKRSTNRKGSHYFLREMDIRPS